MLFRSPCDAGITEYGRDARGRQIVIRSSRPAYLSTKTEGEKEQWASTCGVQWPEKERTIPAGIVCNYAQNTGVYEKYGARVNEWQWVPCYADVYSAEYEEKIYEILEKNPPDVFAISLYVWNYSLAHKIAAWVRNTFPQCIIISGGPHQYFKHDLNWFKEHWYLDASSPGDCYGELCFKEILDNYDDEIGRAHV